MPKALDPSEEDRIWRLYLSGNGPRVIANKLGHPFTQGMVKGIITRMADDLTPPAKERLIQRECEFFDLIRSDMMALATQQPPPAFSPRGHPLTDPVTGNLVRDYNLQLQAIDRALRASERLEKMLGLAAPARAEVTITEAEETAAQVAAAEAMTRLHREAPPSDDLSDGT